MLSTQICHKIVIQFGTINNRCFPLTTILHWVWILVICNLLIYFVPFISPYFSHDPVRLCLTNRDVWLNWRSNTIINRCLAFFLYFSPTIERVQSQHEQVRRLKAVQKEKIYSLNEQRRGLHTLIASRKCEWEREKMESIHCPIGKSIDRSVSPIMHK